MSQDHLPGKADDYDEEPVASVFDRKRRTIDGTSQLHKSATEEIGCLSEGKEKKSSKKKTPNKEERGKHLDNSGESSAFKQALSTDHNDEEPLARKESLKENIPESKGTAKQKLRENSEGKHSPKGIARHGSQKERKKLKKNLKKEHEAKIKKSKLINEKQSKKVYDFPGQKSDPPDERDPLRIFYQSLYKQLPTSNMAAYRLMEWGLLPIEKAKKVYEQKLKSPQKRHHQKVVTGSKTANKVKSKFSKTTVGGKVVPDSSRKRERELNVSDNEDEFVIPAKKNRKLIS